MLHPSDFKERTAMRAIKTLALVTLVAAGIGACVWLLAGEEYPTSMRKPVLTVMPGGKP